MQHCSWVCLPKQDYPMLSIPSSYRSMLCFALRLESQLSMHTMHVMIRLGTNTAAISLGNHLAVLAL
jgi:hypothetical protein